MVSCTARSCVMILSIKCLSLFFLHSFINLRNHRSTSNPVSVACDSVYWGMFLFVQCREPQMPPKPQYDAHTVHNSPLLLPYYPPMFPLHDLPQ